MLLRKWWIKWKVSLWLFSASTKKDFTDFKPKITFNDLKKRFLLKKNKPVKRQFKTWIIKISINTVDYKYTIFVLIYPGMETICWSVHYKTNDADIQWAFFVFWIRREFFTKCICLLILKPFSFTITNRYKAGWNTFITNLKTTDRFWQDHSALWEICVLLMI